MVKELRSIERELLAQRQNAALSAAASLSAVAGSSSPSPRELVADTSPVRAEPKREARRRTRWVVAVLAVLMAIAIVGFVLAPTRKRDVTIMAAEPTPIPDGDRGAVVPVVKPQTDDPPAVQPAAGPDRGAAGVDRGAVSAAVTRPGLAPAPEVSEHKPGLAGHVAPRDGNMTKEMPAASITDAGRAPETRDMTAPDKGPWGDAVDPDGDCKFELEPREDKVRIIVPGKPHILSAEIGHVNAPRLLREIKGDFDLIVRVAGTGNPGGKATTTVYAPYHGAGLLIWQDEENYVRLEIAADVRHGKARPYVNFEYRKDGTLATSSGPMNTDGSNHLRLRRRGDEIYASFGPDGLRWTSFPPLTTKLSARLQVGVSAINSSTKPLTAEFAGLEVLEKPGAGGDPKTGGLNP